MEVRVLIFTLPFCVLKLGGEEDGVLFEIIVVSSSFSKLDLLEEGDDVKGGWVLIITIGLEESCLLWRVECTRTHKQKNNKLENFQ